MDNVTRNLPAILFVLGSAAFLVGNIVLVVRGWK